MTGSATRCSLYAMVGLVALLLLLPFPGAAASAPAFSPPDPHAPAEVWAYGASWGATATESGQATGSSGTFSYTITTHASLGWNVILTQTNTSSTSYMLHANRTLVAQLDIQACIPDCSTPVFQGNITARGWETDSAYANMTTQATVILNGSQSVPAVGVVNESLHVAGNLTGQATWQDKVHGTNGYVYATGAVDAQGALAFSPALALFPQNVSVGDTWTSAPAGWTGSGSYDRTCHVFVDAPPSAPSMLQCGASGTLSGSGQITVSGQDTLAGIDVHGHHYPFHVLTLEVANGIGASYNVEVLDGVVLIPAPSDLYASGDAPTNGASVGAGINTATLDVDPGAPHAGLSAASTTFSGSISSGSVGNVGGLAALAPTVAPATSVPAGSWSIQGEPETPQQASAANQCLLYSAGCAGPAARSNLGGLILLLALIAVAAVLALLVVRRSRRPKGGTPSLTAYPGASPGLTPRARPLPPPPPGGAPPPRPTPSQDPLGNLW